MIGKTISHYKILEKLGEGGMGVVYKAKDLKLDRLVALKFLPPHLGKSKDEKERFIHEAKAASALDHTNICNIHEIDETEDGQLFIAMAHYEGTTLDQRIKRGPLPLNEAVDIAMQIARGLEKAHQKEIVHRDIKPGNILLTRDHVVKILDFGLAKLRGYTKLTKAQTTLGTVSYMSPEQSQGQKVDPRSDIWSLGVVLYEMVTGRRPFTGDYDQAVVYSIMNEQPEPLTGLRTGVPVDLERIVDKCLHKDPAERYQTAGGIMADFRHLQREMTAPSEPSRPEVVTRGRSRFTSYLPWAAALVLITALGVVTLPHLFRAPGKPADHGRKMLVVLPFKNLGTPEDEYFSDGITDAITARLAKISGLGVISRQSAIQYKNSEKSTQEIGEELSVSYILEGTIQRERPTDPSSRVRIIPQLIETEKDIHLWAGTYDETMESIFRVQSAIAESVATALNVVLLEPERRLLEEKPTDNLEAYNLYLQGREYMGRSIEKNDMEIAIELFEKAVSADPDFAEAYAGLAKTHMRMRWFGHDTSPGRLARAKKAVDNALNLKPDDPVVREANGYYYYYGFRDYPRALDEFMFCQRKEPRNASYNANIAYVQRRLGRFEEALENLKIAFQYDPRSNYLARELGHTYRDLRMYTEAEGCHDHAISLAPDIVANYTQKAWTRINKTGTTEDARQILENASKRVDSNSFIWFLITLDIYDGQYQDALNRLTSIQDEVHGGQTVYTPKVTILGFIFGLMGQTDQALIHYKKARTLLKKKAVELPDDPRIHVELGKVLAHLGFKDEAIREGKKAVDLVPVSRDALMGPKYLEELAEIYTIVGDYNAAMDNIEYLLEIPAGMHIGELKASPVWNPLHDHPRFIRLLEGGE
jgi:serine/threonine protein kinase/Flp pilus assembly protein TadD